MKAPRKRDGATFWRVYKDLGEPSRYVERFIVSSWADYLHQRARAESISTAPGVLFSADQRFTHHLRLNVGHPGDARFDGAIKTLGQLALDLQALQPALEQRLEKKRTMKRQLNPLFFECDQT